MGELPSGTVTFLFTDIEGSTRLLRATGDRYSGLLDTHRQLVRDAVTRHGGHEVHTEGDSFFVAFAKATDAVHAALDAQRALCAHPWIDGEEVFVRMGLHTGEASVAGHDYVGLAVHQAARVMSAAHGRQVLVSGAAWSLVHDSTLDGLTFRDLGFHRLKDIEHPQQLFQIIHDDLPADFPAAASIESLPGNLPELLTSFIGRAEDVPQTTKLLKQSRLVTLTGAGGVGKTRLALHVASQLIPDFPDGAWLVDLAPIAEPTLVGLAAASALGLAEEQGTPRPWGERVIDHLHDRHALIVLDNCEHLLAPSADLVVSILRQCPEIRILVTTREPLGVEGEIAWRVPSLSASEDAMQLFIERTREALPGYEPDDVSVIEAICEQLDGIPLAIELAAARMQVLTPPQILERLSDRFHLLRGGGRRRIERQQTLRAAVDWSYGLLDESERALLRRLAVFAGGFTLDLAEAVCADDVVSGDVVLELLDTLTRKSLVTFEAKPSGPRYRMLETIRQYGLEKLIEADEASAVRNRHRMAMCSLTERIKPGIRSDDLTAFAELGAELDNLRAALEWSAPGDDGSIALRTVAAAAEFFLYFGYVAEGFQRTVVALEADRCEPGPLRVDALASASVLAFHLGRLDEQKRFTAEADALLRVVGDWPDRSHAETGTLISHAMQALLVDRDRDRALALLDQAADVGRRSGDPIATAWALFNTASLRLEAGEFERGRRTIEEALVLNAGNVGSAFRATLLPGLAYVQFAGGDIDAAAETANEALALSRQIGAPVFEMRALYAIFQVAFASKDFELAHASADELLMLGRAQGEVYNGIVPGLTARKMLCDAAGDHDGAATARQELASYPGAPADDEPQTLDRLTNDAQTTRADAP